MLRIIESTDERALARQARLEHRVQAGRHHARQGQAGRRNRAGGAGKQRHGDDQEVPDEAVAQTTDDREHLTHAGERQVAVQAVAEPELERFDVPEQCRYLPRRPEYRAPVSFR